MDKINTIATLGGHSALEICLGAKKEGLKTLVIAMQGRDKTYTQYFKNIVDKCVLVESFENLTDKETIIKLQLENSIFIPHRYCQVYCDIAALENKFPIPIFGNKYLLKYEERTGAFNQYQLFYNAQVDYPQRFKNAREIDRLVIVKVKEAQRNYERAFFFARNFKEYEESSEKLLEAGKIVQKDLNEAVIEEYLVGAQVNFNFFYSPLTDSLELLGTDIRRQTNIDGLLRVPFEEQKEISEYVKPSYIETGHIAVTVKESLLEQAFHIAERLVDAARTYVPPGIIGPFALQSAVLAGPPKEKIVVYDLSLRMPGSPGTSFTPYSQYHFGEPVSFGLRIAREIKKAIETGNIGKIIT